jgi:nucleoside-diphosphate-sugar epimerase
MQPLSEVQSQSGTAFAGEAFNFSYGLRLSVLDLVQKILCVMNREGLKPVVLNQANNEIPVQCLNSDKAKTLLNWKARFGFDEGLKLTIDWYRKVLAS